MSRRAAASKRPNVTSNKAVVNFLVRTIHHPQITPEAFNYFEHTFSLKPKNFIKGDPAWGLLCRFGFHARGLEDIEFMTSRRNDAFRRTPNSLIDCNKVRFVIQWLENKNQLRNLKQKYDRQKRLNNRIQFAKNTMNREQHLRRMHG